MWRDGRKVKDKKDRSCDKSEEEEEDRRRYFNTSVVCFSGPAGKRRQGGTLKHFTCMN